MLRRVVVAFHLRNLADRVCTVVVGVIGIAVVAEATRVPGGLVEIVLAHGFDVYCACRQQQIWIEDQVRLQCVDIARIDAGPIDEIEHPSRLGLIDFAQRGILAVVGDHADNRVPTGDFCATLIAAVRCNQLRNGRSVVSQRVRPLCDLGNGMVKVAIRLFGSYTVESVLQFMPQHECDFFGIESPCW